MEARWVLACGMVIAMLSGFAVPSPAHALLFGLSRNTALNKLTTDIGNAPVAGSGWYGQGLDSSSRCCDSGYHYRFNSNYIAGRGIGGRATLFRDFWVFDIGGLTSHVSAASFQVFSYLVDTSWDGEPSVVLNLYHVDTPIPVLVADNSNRGDIYADLGAGAIYGSRVYTNGDADTLVTIPLNSVLITDLNQAIDNGARQLAIGGALAEPSTLALLGLPLLAFVTCRRRRWFDVVNCAGTAGLNHSVFATTDRFDAKK